jgi:hypothetical protein
MNNARSGLSRLQTRVLASLDDLGFSNLGFVFERRPAFDLRRTV